MHAFHDPINKRTVTMWDRFGMRLRSNIVEPGGVIPLHAHSYDHLAFINGVFDLHAEGPAGEVIDRHVERGVVEVPAHWRHTFHCVGDVAGEVICVWPAAAGGTEA